jgi:hypothetical protein
MRILFHSPPPWSARSGYCVQAAHAVRALRDNGHEVGLSCYGYHGQDKWDGFPVYGCGIAPYGNGLIAYNYRRHQAELVILLCDTWMIEQEQLAGLTVMPWVMVDCEPLGIMDRMWLDRVGKIAELRPVTTRRWCRWPPGRNTGRTPRPERNGAAKWASALTCS